MASLNKVQIIGHIGQDPKCNTTKSGKTVANFSVATTSRSKDQQTGDWVEVTEWHRVVCYDKLADVIRNYASKGKQVYIEGRLKYGQYKKEDGTPVPTTEIVANEIQLLGKKDDAPASQPAPVQQVKKPSTAGSGFDDLDDDVPF